MGKGGSIKELKWDHYGRTAHIIGSGASMEGFIPYREWFYDYDKLVIAVNDAFIDWPCDYALMHHHDRVQEAIDKECVVVTSEHDCGFHDRPRADFRGHYYTYRTENNKMEPTLNLNALDREADDELIISACTTAEAMHFAYFLGADAVVLCGVDGGAVDGKFNYAGYNGGAGTDPDHLRSTRGILIAVANALRKRGVLVATMTPWVGLDMEGHQFESMEVKLG